MKTLNLVLKRKWFDMIKSGEKKEEYSELKEYWRSRLFGKEYDVVTFYHGYSKDRESITFEVKSIHIGRGREEWGGDGFKTFFIIELGKLIE